MKFGFGKLAANFDNLAAEELVSVDKLEKEIGDLGKQIATNSKIDRIVRKKCLA